MANHSRTYIQRLKVTGYRRLRCVELADLPPIIVFYGPNGSGKSNLLRAIRLLLTAVGLAQVLPLRREEGHRLSMGEANSELGLRAEDFFRGGPKEIRVALEVALGSRAVSILGQALPSDSSTLFLEGVFQEHAEDQLIFWCERADVDGILSLGPSQEPGSAHARQQIAIHRSALEQATLQTAALRAQVAAHADQNVRAQLEASYRAAFAQHKKAVESSNAAIAQLESELGREALLADRIRYVLCRELVQLHDAYRMPGGEAERRLHRALLADDPRDLEAVDRLAERLGTVGLFGNRRGSVGLRPVETRYGEREVLFQRPPHGWMSMRNLGTGEQQIILMLSQHVITEHPVAHLEEPEAHLHPALMGPFADFLRQAIDPPAGKPDTDQLWMATHHHLFALTPTYFDVSLDSTGATNVSVKPRSEAAKHFYEPGPFWDALRELMESGLSADDVVSRNAEGAPILAKDVLASLNGDERLARDFVNDAMRSVLLALRAKSREQPK